MSTYFQERTSSQDGISPISPSGQSLGPTRGSSALSNRVTNVLSASYSDLEIREALNTLDSRTIQNNQETRRQLRLDVQREIIQCNGNVIKDFGQVARVSMTHGIT